MNSDLIPEGLLKELGILDWAYVEGSVPASFSRYQQWINNSQQGPLNYLSDYRQEKRSDLTEVYPDFQSAVVFLFSYQPTKKWMLENNQHSVAAYTLGFEGEDYHHALKLKLQTLFAQLKVSDPQLECFISLDAQPVMERDLAFRAGLGWFGKNSMLISRKEGSYFLIGSLLLNQKLPLTILPVDSDHCGQCTACADACPTEAINLETRTLIADKCISTFTIEVMKDASPPAGFDKSRGEVFGCDICQDVCPWNSKPLTRIGSDLKLQDKFIFLKEWLLDHSKQKLHLLMEQESNRSLKRKLQGSPFDRPGRAGWLKNLKAHLLAGKN